MMFPFRSVPFHLNGIRPFRSPFSSRFACASDQLTHCSCLTNVAGTRASSFAREPRIDGCTLPLSSKLRWDTVLLPLF